jgi:hypothetical protein
MVIYAPGIPPCLIAEEQRSQLPTDFDDFDDLVVVASGAELQAVIESA